MPQSRAASSPFLALVPRRSAIIFFAAVFFIFSPVGVLLGSSLVERRPLPTLLLAGLLSGCIAVSWAATFTLSRRWIVGIVLFTAAQMAFFGPLGGTAFGIREASFSLEGVSIVAVIVLGYTLFVIFISGQGRTTLRLQTEMALAREIHATLAPPLELSRERFEVLGLSRASSEMGGDLVDAVDHAETTDLVLADVSGHGVKAGVVMGMLKSAIRTVLLRPAPLAELLTALNDVLERTTAPEMYATLAVVRIGAGGERAEYALAGHHPILHHRAGAREVVRLAQRQLPLGLMPCRTFDTGSVALAPGDLLALYTDGLAETENAAGEALGHEPVERLLVERAGAPLPEIQRELFELAGRHGERVDDQTILLLRVRGAA